MQKKSTIQRINIRINEVADGEITAADIDTHINK